MARIDVELVGADRLRRTLGAAADDLDDMTKPHAQAATVVVPRARAGAPVGETGRLAGSVRGKGTKTAAEFSAGGPGIPYAAVQEYGYAAHNIPAQPYLTPAIENTESSWIGFYEADLESVLGQVKGA